MLYNNENCQFCDIYHSVKINLFVLFFFSLMFYATFYATVRNTHSRFKKGDTFPVMTVKVRLYSGDLCAVYSSNPIKCFLL